MENTFLVFGIPLLTLCCFVAIALVCRSKSVENLTEQKSTRSKAQSGSRRAEPSGRDMPAE